jgi:quercetin dioxygenase-like cupin family protein
MHRVITTGFVLAVCLGLAHGNSGEGDKKHADEHVVVKPGDLKWGPAPPALPSGAQVAVLVGDPGKTGSMFAIRVKLPDGYVVPPHWHPSDENVTVLKGTLLIGKGTKFDPGHADELPAGSYMRMPKEMRHFAKAKGETILQVHGVGPFEFVYVNPEDDPRKKK